MISKSCEICKTSFDVSPSVTKKFCSRVCFFESRKGKSSAMKGRNHSKETKVRISQSLMGNKHFPKSYISSCISCGNDFESRTFSGKWCEACVPDREADHRMRSYGLTQPAYEKMLCDQNGICALCDKEAVVVDHDHETNVVRGLLCYGCNTCLSRVELSGWMIKALEYVKRGKI